MTSPGPRAAGPQRAFLFDRRRPLVVAALTSCAILAVSVVILAANAYRDVNVYDEGVAAYGAMRVAAGEIPYRDFWAVYAPADFYLLAALFKLFGASLIVERHAWVLLEGVLALLVYVIARRLGGRAWAVLCWSALLLWTARVPFFGSPMTPALVCCLTALLATVVLLDPSDPSDPSDVPDIRDRNRSRDTRLAVIAGVMVAICALFRQDFGACTFVSIAATLAFAADGRRPLYGLVAAVIITLTPAVAAMFLFVPAARLYETFIDFPSRIYPATRAFPPPPLPGNPFGAGRGGMTFANYLNTEVRSWQFYGSIVVLCATAAWSVATILRRWRSVDSSVGAGLGTDADAGLAVGRKAFLIATSGLLMLTQVRLRSDIFHLYPVFIFTLLACASIPMRARWMRPVLASAAALSVVAMALLTWHTAHMAASKQTAIATPRASGLFALNDSRAYARAIDYVQQTVPPEAAIFVGNSRHDRLDVNDVLFYFLSGRRSATRYHDLHPGVATTAAVQDEIVRDLEREQVSCVVLWNNGGGDNGTNGSDGSGQPDGARVLDHYIAERFTPGPRFEDYQVWIRRTAAR